jgi:hypothetical protein
MVPWCRPCCVQVLTETFGWIRTAVTDFLLPAFNVKSLIDWSKEGLGNANSATRTAAVQLLGTMHAFLGPALGNMVSAAHAAGSAAVTQQHAMLPAGNSVEATDRQQLPPIHCSRCGVLWYRRGSQEHPTIACFCTAAQVSADLKPASMATVEAEFEKQPQRSDWQATRVSRSVVTGYKAMLL